MHWFLISICFSFFPISFQATNHAVHHQKKYIDASKHTINTRFQTEANFSRVSIDSTSFAYYLRHLPLKAIGTKVHYYNGATKEKLNVYCAVVDLDIGKRDLQQCADAVIRLRAEYLYKRKKYDAISFRFTNGFEAMYSKWRQGYRIAVRGNQVSWYKTSQKSDTYTSFRAYLNLVFAYAGTQSLSKELKPVSISSIQIGDVFIQGGFPGHAIIVVDMASNNKGEKQVLLAQSYMPAQDIQLLVNPLKHNKSAWYDVNKTKDVILTPEWVFATADLKRF